MDDRTVADYRLEARAENELWPVTQRHRVRCVNNALKDLKDPDGRIRKAARDYLLAVDRANDKKLADRIRKQESEHSRKLQLIELAVKLGIAGDVGTGTGSVHSNQPQGIDARGAAAT